MNSPADISLGTSAYVAADAGYIFSTSPSNFSSGYASTVKYALHPGFTPFNLFSSNKTSTYKIQK